MERNMECMKIWRILFVTFGLLLLSACSSAPEEYEEVTMTAEEKMADDNLVVTINDEEVYGDTYNELYLQIKTRAVRAENAEANDQGYLQEETLETIINNTLFIQLAESKGIVMDDSAMETDLKQLKKLDESGYRELIDKYNYTEEGIGNQIRLEKVRKEYIEQFVSVNVTDEEVQEFYDETKAATDEEIPDYDSAYKTLKETLEVNKSLEDVAEQIEAFRNTSDIIVH